MATTLVIHGAHITLVQAVKRVGLADTGGQAKLLVRSGRVHVNDVAGSRPGRKLVPGDRFRLDEQEWVIGQ